MKKRYPRNGAKECGASLVYEMPETALLEKCRDLVEATVEEVGRLMVTTLLEASAACLTGPSHRGVAGDYVRHGSQGGAVYVGRKKVRVTRPRVRTKDGKEARIPAYEVLRDGGPAAKKVHDTVLAGVSTRRYAKAVEDGLNAVGVSKSSVSRKFVKESADRLKEFMERPVPKEILAFSSTGCTLASRFS